MVISKVFEQGPRRTALGIYNFSGDLGKMVLPFIAAIVIAGFDWRWVSTGAGVIGIFGGILIYIVLLVIREGGASKNFANTSNNSKFDGKIKGWGIKNSAGFKAISAIGIIDGAARSGFLTFLPFLLITLLFESLSKCTHFVLIGNIFIFLL